MLCVQFLLTQEFISHFFFEVLGFWEGGSLFIEKFVMSPVSLDISVCSMLQVILARMK